MGEKSRGNWNIPFGKSTCDKCEWKETPICARCRGWDKYKEKIMEGE